LAGIGTLTIVDHETVKEEDLGAQFFISEEHVGQNVCRPIAEIPSEET
jgi:ubiquitin-like 1-activating enzyme E1 A